MRRGIRWTVLMASLLLAACAGMPHGDPNPPEGYGGYAEWRWPYQTPGESWADQMPHPDKVPTGFRTAQVRLKHMREGCAWLLFPAYVSVAERQYNKALRAFASEYYDDAFVDLRALNNQLDEIDRRLEIAGAQHGCHNKRNRYHDGHLRGTCTGHHDEGHGKLECGHTGAEFNCASGPDALRKPGCGKVKPCGQSRTDAATRPSCNKGQCPHRKRSHGQPHGVSAPATAAPDGYRALDNLYLKTQFPYNSDQVLPEYRGYLEQLVQQLHQRNFPPLLIQGHASAEGSDDYNRKLASRRAQQVVQILTSLGVPRSSMHISSFGEGQPTAPNTTEQGRAANRRVEIYVQLPPTAAAPPAP